MSFFDQFTGDRGQGFNMGDALKSAVIGNYLASQQAGYYTKLVQSGVPEREASAMTQAIFDKLLENASSLMLALVEVARALPPVMAAGAELLKDPVVRQALDLDERPRA